MKTYILLDRSGSMCDLWDDTIGGINSYVKNLKGKQNVFLAVFDSTGEKMQYDVVRDCAKSAWKPLSPREVEPRGGTPLNDALAETILRMLEDNEKRAVLVVMTDGHENASLKFNGVAVQTLLKRIEKKDWQTVFLGANFDGIKEQAKSYGVDFMRRGILAGGQSIGSTYSMLAEKSNMYASAPVFTSSEELSATMDFSMMEQDQVKK